MRTPARAVALALCWLAGCSSKAAHPDGAAGASGVGGSSAGSSGADGAAGMAGAGGAPDTTFGNIAVNLFPDNDPPYTTVTAQFFASEPPPMIPVRVAQEEAGCQLLVPTNPTCGAGCDGGVCTATDQCAAHPQPSNAGTLAVDGLSGMHITMDPVPPMFAYASPTLTQPFPPCAEGDDITVSAPGFTVGISCIAPLVVTSAVPIPVLANQAAHLEWTPPGMVGISHILIALEISHHGGYKGEIDCDEADTGSFDIPATLVTALINLGRAGYPTVQITRVSTNTAVSEPAVKLSMPSRAELAVDTGVISCGASASDVCPSGQTCDDNSKTCQ